jgi:integrase
LVTIPEFLTPVIGSHLVEFVDPAPDAFVFTGPAGTPIWRGNLNKLLRWGENVAAVGAPGLHFHDLRHTGNMLAASTGATLRNLMARMGHDNSAAALVYQHASSAADRAIARAVDVAVRARLADLAGTASRRVDGQADAER